MKKQKSEEIPPVTDISIYVAALQATYKPAHTPAEATHFFSTEEVVEAIKELDPASKVDSNLVFAALREAGFDFCNRPGSQGLAFRWMFLEK